MKHFSLVLFLCALTGVLCASECIQRTSQLCEYFGLDEKLCLLPLDLQHEIAEKILGRFPEALSDCIVTEPIARLAEHTSPVTSLVFMNHGKILISSSTDGHIVFWDLESFKKIREFSIEIPKDAVSTSPVILAVNDEETLLAVSRRRGLAQGQIVLFALDTLEKRNEIDVSFVPGVMWFLPENKIFAGPEKGVQDMRFCVGECQSGEKLEFPMSSGDIRFVSAVSSQDKKRAFINTQGFVYSVFLRNLSDLIDGEEPDFDFVVGNPDCSRIAAFYIDSKHLFFVRDASVTRHFWDKKDYWWEEILKIESCFTMLRDMKINCCDKEKRFINACYDLCQKKLLIVTDKGIAILYDQAMKNNSMIYVDGPVQNAATCALNESYSFTTQSLSSVANKRYYAITLWPTSALALLFSKKRCSIKQALLLLLLHELKKNVLKPKVRKVTIRVPEAILTELRDIASNFSPEQKNVIRYTYSTLLNTLNNFLFF